MAGRVLTFVVGRVSIEFSGEGKRVHGAGGGVKFWVVTADARAERSTGATHKVTVELISQALGGGSVIVADDVDAAPVN